MAKGLTKKQELFVAAYIIDLNATKSAIAAGYSEKGAEQQGSVLLSNPKVSQEIQKKLAPKFKKLDISAERVLNEVARCAFLDPRKFYDESGNLIPIPKLDEDTVAALAGMEIEEAYEHFGKGQAKPTGELKKIKFSSKLEALKLLMQYQKLLIDRVEVTGFEGLAEAIKKARERASKK